MTGTFKRDRTGTHKLVRAVSPPIRRFTLTRLDEPGSPQVLHGGTAQIGAHMSNDVCIEEHTVSRFHCEISVTRDGAIVKDLNSSNGTEVDGVRVREAFLKNGSQLKLGKALVRFQLELDSAPEPLSKNDSFGPLLGGSPAMRACFALLERAAETSRHVLLEGETGTGKSIAAEAIHERGARQNEPFLIVDCSSLTAAELEATLFGREAPRRLSVFEEARGGTILIDEISELPIELQGRLLTVLENAELKRAGGATVDVRARIIASTRVDLRQRVNDQKFRSELYFRLAVMRVRLPSLRAHLDDVPDLVDQWLEDAGLSEEEAAPLRTPDFVARLQAGAWPGNVRELFNHLDRCRVMQAALNPTAQTEMETPAYRPPSASTWAEAKRLANEDFERAFVEALLARHKGKVSEAARAAQIDRVYLYRIIKRHGLKA